MKHRQRMPLCPHCKDRHTRWSHARLFDLPLLLFARPARCEQCYARFWKFMPLRAAVTSLAIIAYIAYR